MFFIVNKTKNNITINDINVSLGPRQAVDLDRIIERSISENSKHLRLAISKGQIEVRSKDGENKSILRQSVSDNNPLDKMKQDIIGELRKTIVDATKGIGSFNSQGTIQNSDNVVTKDDINRLIETVSSLVGSANNGNSNGNSNKIKIDNSEDVEMDIDTLIEINARTVDKIVGNSETKLIQYKEKKSNSNVLSNINELEDLLG